VLDDAVNLDAVSLSVVIVSSSVSSYRLHDVSLLYDQTGDSVPVASHRLRIPS